MTLQKIKKTVTAKKEYKPLVYICSPYSGDVAKNVERTVDFCRFALDKGQIPLAPHLMFPQFMDDKAEERELALFMDIILLGKCDELWVLGPVISKGMRKEIAVSEWRHQTIRYFNEEFMEVDEIE